MSGSVNTVHNVSLHFCYGIRVCSAQLFLFYIDNLSNEECALLNIPLIMSVLLRHHYEYSRISMRIITSERERMVV